VANLNLCRNIPDADLDTESLLLDGIIRARVGSFVPNLRIVSGQWEIVVGAVTGLVVDSVWNAFLLKLAETATTSVLPLTTWKSTVSPTVGNYRCVFNESRRALSMQDLVLIGRGWWSRIPEFGQCDRLEAGETFVFEDIPGEWFELRSPPGPTTAL